MAGVQPKFPAELVSLILSHTSIRDVVRWRTVSKWFQTITHDPYLWKDLYMNTPFLRPRKPFPTNASFEDALTQSARLAHSWTTQPLRTLSHFQVPFDGYATDYPKPVRIIGGKWLFVCQEWRRFVLYEIDPNPEARLPQVIWEQEDRVSEWDSSMGKFDDGKWSVYILLYTRENYYWQRGPQWKLLEVHVDAESGTSCDTIDLDMGVVDPRDGRMRLDSGGDLYARSPFLWIEARSLVLDTRTRILYKFPEFHVEEPEMRSKVDSQHSDSLDPLVVVTNTHVIAFRHYMMPHDGVLIVVQGFTIPNNQCTSSVEKENNVLRFSHEGAYDHISAARSTVTILRNSIVDPVTGATSVKLCHQPLQYNDFDGLCLELTFHASSTKQVAPITIHKLEPVMRGNTPWRSIRNTHSDTIFQDICDDGYARGFLICTQQYAYKALSGIIKFELDATQDGCIVVFGQFSPVDLNLPLMTKTSFDGVRGRFCYTANRAKDLYNGPLTVMDFE